MKNNIKNIYRKFYYQFLKRNYSAVTAPLRVLPDFIIFGSVRSGSTSLYHDICEHPSVLPAAFDEIGFFDSNYHLGMNWYRSMFPRKRDIDKKMTETNYAITGEDTPFYFWKKEVPSRILSHLPDCKLLCILRNPIDRAYSNYHISRKFGTEKLSFEESVQEEMARIEKQVSREDFDNTRSNLAKGLYHHQLLNWYDTFPREKIFVLSTEDLSSEPNKTLNDVFSFLKIPEYELQNPQKNKVEKYENMSSKTRSELVKFFMPYNEQLFELIQKKFNWNK
tara:strand:+ start:530 stop:1366 length:837 start_codon:yes stop_codon:yes gene_type:complete